MSSCNQHCRIRDAYDIYCNREQNHDGYHFNHWRSVIWLDGKEPEPIFDYIHWLERKVQAGHALAEQVTWSVDDIKKAKKDNKYVGPSAFWKEVAFLETCINEYSIKTCEHNFIDPSSVDTTVINAGGYQICMKCGILKEPNEQEEETKAS